MLHKLDLRRPRQATSDDGDTLIEVVIAAAIVGIAAVALIGSILTSITASSEHQSLAVNDATAKSYASEVSQQVQRQASAAWQDCASSYAITPPSNLPANYSVELSTIQYWSSSGNTGSWGSTCPAPSAPQLITVTVTSPTQVTTTLSTVVRKPS